MGSFVSRLVLSDEVSYRLGRHFLFWITCTLFFATIYGSLWQEGPGSGLFKNTALLDAIIFLPCHIFLSYGILYYLIPSYLLKGRYAQLIAGVIFLILATAVLSSIVSIGVVVPLHRKLGVPGPFNNIFYGFMAGLRGSNTVAGFATAIKLVKFWYFKKIENERLEKEKLRAELGLLKSQLQPHFLLNTLNNLYGLILSNSREAGEVVLRLSGLLRYMLSDPDRLKVELQTEIDLLRDYIRLEQLRFGERLDLALHITGDFEKKQIAPLMLLPLVENAFKHGANQVLNQPWMTIDLHVVGNELSFKVINCKAESGLVAPESNHIGLRNVGKRLDLMYPGKHQFKLQDRPDSFLVSLNLELEML